MSFNLYKLNKFTKDNEVVIVPGKVLAVGDIDHPITVAAFTFSGSAQEKINKVGKTILSIFNITRPAALC